MPEKQPRQPKYCLHKPTGQAYVRLGGKVIYLGKHDTPESLAAYDRWVAAWLSNGNPITGLASVNVSSAVHVAPSSSENRMCIWASVSSP